MQNSLFLCLSFSSGQNTYRTSLEWGVKISTSQSSTFNVLIRVQNLVLSDCPFFFYFLCKIDGEQFKAKYSYLSTYEAELMLWKLVKQIWKKVLPKNCKIVITDNCTCTRMHFQKKRADLELLETTWARSKND